MAKKINTPPAVQPEEVSEHLALNDEVLVADQFNDQEVKQASADTIAMFNGAVTRDEVQSSATSNSATDPIKELIVVINNLITALDGLELPKKEKDAGAANLTGETYIDNVKSLIDAYAKYRKAVNDVADAREALRAATEKGDEKEIAAAQKQVDTLNAGKKKQFENLKKIAGETAKSLTTVGSAMKKLGQDSGDGNLASFGKALEDIGGIAKGFAEGGVIGGALAAIQTGLGAILSAGAKQRKIQKQIEEDQLNFAHKYYLALSDIALEAKHASNAFTTDNLEKALAYIKQVHDVYKKFTEEVNKKTQIKKLPKPPALPADYKKFTTAVDKVTPTKNSSSSFNFSYPFGSKKTTSTTSSIFTSITKNLPKNTFANRILPYETDLQNMYVQTRHGTMFRRSQGYRLGEKYPKMFEGDDDFDVNYAKIVLETDSLLGDDAKRALKETIALYEQYKKAEEQFNEYITSTFGAIGDSLGDSIVNAFKNGTDAMELWAGSFQTVLENLGKQIMQHIFFQKAFDELDADIKKIYDDHMGDGSDPEQMRALGAEVRALLGAFNQNMTGQVALAEEFYKEWAEQAKAYGFDLAAGESARQGTTKGIAQISQNSADELNGRLTVMQQHSYDIREATREINFSMSKMYENAVVMNAYLSDIRDNTEFCRRLAPIEEGINTIVTRGVTIRE